jgi:hypothetical protein
VTIARTLHGKLLSTARAVFWSCASVSACVRGLIASTYSLHILAKLASYTLVLIDATPVVGYLMQRSSYFARRGREECPE